MFWQYTEHRNVAGRLIYLAYYHLFGKLDFFEMSIIGAIILILLAWLTGELFANPTDLPPGHFPSTRIIPFALLLSMVMWQGAFWAMNSISVVLFSTVSMATLVLLKQRSLYAFIAAIGFLGLIITAGLAGVVVMFFIGMYVLVGSQSKTRKAIWIVSSLLATAVLLSTYTDHLQYSGHTRQETLDFIVEHPMGFLRTYLAFIGGLPFDSRDSLWPGAALGLGLMAASAYLLHRYWFENRRHFYRLLALFGLFYGLMFAACVGRYLYLGEFISYASRYKQYPAVLTSLILMGYMQRYPRPAVCYSLVVLALAMTVYGYVRFLPQAIKQSAVVQERLTRWAADGSYRSLGMVGIAPHAEQILFWSIDSGLYDPYRSPRAILHRHRPPEPLPACPMAVDHGMVEMDAFVLNQPYSLGARVMMNNLDAHHHIETLYLCGAQSAYGLEALEPASDLSLETARLLPGTYRLFFTSTQGRSFVIRQPLMVRSHRSKRACETKSFEGAATFKDEVAKVFCR